MSSGWGYFSVGGEVGRARAVRVSVGGARAVRGQVGGAICPVGTATLALVVWWMGLDGSEVKKVGV